MKKTTTLLLSLFCFINIAFACINDASSVYFESQPFPDEQQLIEGSFHIHSKEFYEWRIKDRLKRLEQKTDDPALLDDLAVSYEKLGQTQKAIATLNAVLKKYPERYETLANLGTFYIHHKEYEKGLVLLKKAIKINPNTHYGREIYQIKAVEYLLSTNSTKTNFPIQKDKNFADFVLKEIPKSQQKDELIRAIVGISGMLKFGNSDSPILFELLGDLYSRITTDYLWSQETSNPLLTITKDFYLSAYLTSPVKDMQALILFKDSNPIIFNKKSRTLSERFVEEENYLNKYLSTLIENRRKGLDKKIAMQNEEIEITKTSNTPEQDIFKSVMSEKNVQQISLFELKKKKITRMIRVINTGFIINSINNCLIFLNFVLTGIFAICLILITYHINVIMVKFLSKIDEIMKSIKWMYLILMTFIGSIIFIPIFLDQYINNLYALLIIGICFSIYSIYFYWVIKFFNKNNGFKSSIYLEKTLKIIMYCYSVTCIIIFYYLLTDILTTYIYNQSLIKI